LEYYNREKTDIRTENFNIIEEIVNDENTIEKRVSIDDKQNITEDK
jgi:hypothetical protein